MSPDAAFAAVTAIPPVSTVAEAISRMESIDSVLSAGDGLACFNRMYLQVTRLVADRLEAGFFADQVFVDTLDVTFANRYLSAAAAAGDGSLPVSPGVPRCWAALLDSRTSERVAPIQFALAGMNAHINHDLPLAVVDTCEQLGTAPDDGTHHDDYGRINDLLEGVEAEVRQSFESGIVRAVDQELSPVETVLANWSIDALATPHGPVHRRSGRCGSCRRCARATSKPWTGWSASPAAACSCAPTDTSTDRSPS